MRRASRAERTADDDMVRVCCGCASGAACQKTEGRPSEERFFSVCVSGCMYMCVCGNDAMVLGDGRLKYATACG